VFQRFRCLALVLAILRVGEIFLGIFDLLPQLGLRHIYIRIPQRAMVDYAWGYDAKNRPVRVSPGVFDAEAYGVKSTAADVIRFVQIQLDPSGLEDPMRRAVAGTHQGHFEVRGMVQGLGWEQYP